MDPLVATIEEAPTKKNMSARTTPKVESWTQSTVTTNTYDGAKQRSTYVVVACMHMLPMSSISTLHPKK
jgi:hypothetical protein